MINQFFLFELTSEGREVQPASKECKKNKKIQKCLKIHQTTLFEVLDRESSPPNPKSAGSTLSIRERENTVTREAVQVDSP